MRTLHTLAILMLLCTIASADGDDKKRKPVADLPEIKELPNPFRFQDGTLVKTARDWERRRRSPPDGTTSRL